MDGTVQLLDGDEDFVVQLEDGTPVKFAHWMNYGLFQVARCVNTVSSSDSWFQPQPIS